MSPYTTWVPVIWRYLQHISAGSVAVTCAKLATKLFLIPWKTNKRIELRLNGEKNTAVERGRMSNERKKRN